MITDPELKIKGFEILNKNLDEVEIERFIILLQQDKFDYTKWQANLWSDISIKQLSKVAMENAEPNNIADPDNLKPLDFSDYA